MNKKRIIVIVASIFAVGVITGLYLYFKPASVSSSGEPDYKVTLNTWLADLDSDTAASRNFSKYINKSVQFEAFVSDVFGDTSITLLLSPGKEESPIEVYANFDASLLKEVEAVVVGDGVTVQCICNGLEIPETSMEEDPGLALLNEMGSKQLKLSRCSLLKHSKNEADLSVSLEHADSFNQSSK